MVDLYGNAAKYERQKSKLDEWPTSPENRRRIKSYLASCVDHLSPGRRSADLWYLRKLFVGTGPNKGDPYVKKRLSSLVQSRIGLHGSLFLNRYCGRLVAPLIPSSLRSRSSGCVWFPREVAQQEADRPCR